MLHNFEMHLAIKTKFVFVRHFVASAYTYIVVKALWCFSIRRIALKVKIESKGHGL